MNAFYLNSVPATLTIWLMASILVLPMPADSLLGLALFGVIFTRLYRQWPFSLDTRSLPWLCATLLVGYLVCSVAWSPFWDWQDIVQVGLRGLLVMAFIAAIADAQAAPQEFLLALSRCLAVAVLIAVVASIALWLYWPPDDGRLEGLFRLNNAGKFGRTLAVILPVTMAGALHDPGRWRLVHTAACVATVIALVMTDTRSAWLGATVGFIAFAVATWQPQPRAFMVTLSVIGLLLLTVLLVIVFHPNPDITRALLPRADSFRLLIWSAHIDAIRQGSVLFGQGFLAELIVPSAETTHRGAHSMYLSTLMQGGLIALGLFLLVIAGTAVRVIGRLQMPLARCAVAVLLAGIVTFVFDGDRLIDKLNLVWIALWLPLAVAVTRWLPTGHTAGTQH
jgi:O-antigen ligase